MPDSSCDSRRVAATATSGRRSTRENENNENEESEMTTCYVAYPRGDPEEWLTHPPGGQSLL
jgi:hypothetical protein